MSTSSPASPDAEPIQSWRDTRTALIIIAAITLARLAGLFLTPLNLGPDEAQYWRWGDTLDWGYWSKPPLIAWTIHVTTALFGNAEWAVRLSAPLAHGFGAAMILLTGRAAFGSRTGLIACLFYLLMPGVALSSSIMSTDGLLLPLWSMGLFMMWRLRSGEGGWLTAAGLGLAIGLGLLAKYAMVYFLIGLGLAALADPATRRALVSLKALAALAVAAALFAPHLAWNAANSFKTVSHTVDNVNLEGHLLNPDHAVTFLVDQMGVFGPIAFLCFLGALIGFARGEGSWLKRPQDRFFLCFILPPLVIILFQAVLSRAHANWAATAYPAASVLTAAWLLRAGKARWPWIAIAVLIVLGALSVNGLPVVTKLVIGAGMAAITLLAGWRTQFRYSGLAWGSILLHAVVGLAVFIITSLPAGVADDLGLANAFKRLRAWPETAGEIYARAREQGASAVLVDEREVYHGLDYYGRDSWEGLPLRTWRVGDGAKSFAEEFVLQPGEDAHVLIVSSKEKFLPRMEGDFASFEPAGTLTIPLGGGKTRDFELFLASGYDPVPRERAAPVD